MIMMAGKLRNPITVDNCQRKWEMRSQQPHWNDEMIACFAYLHYIHTYVPTYKVALTRLVGTNHKTPI